MKKILIVEDNPDIAASIEWMLQKNGYEVTTFHDGELGLNWAHKSAPDLVILDLMLPFLSGEEFCKAMRESEESPFNATPILMLTAKASDADRIVGKVMGADGYLTKPFEFDHLLEQVRRLLKG